MSSYDNERNGLKNSQNQLRRLLGLDIKSAEDNEPPKQDVQKSSASKYGQITIKYEDVSKNDQSINGTTSTIGLGDTPFTEKVNFEHNNVPNGYEFDHVIDNVDKFIAGKSQTFIIGLKPVEKSDNATVKVTVNYYMANDHKISSKAFAGAPDKLLTLSDLKANTPADYQYDPKHNQQISDVFNGNAKIFRDDTSLDVVVTPVTGIINICYVDKGRNMIGKPEKLVKPAGTSFNVKSYLSKAPEGYEVIGLLNHTSVKKFLKNQAQTVMIEVERQSVKKSRGPQKVTMNLIYKDINSDKVVKQYQIQGQAGQSVDTSAYENDKYLPAGYQPTDLVDGALDYEADQQLVIYVQNSEASTFSKSTTNHTKSQSASVSLAKSSASHASVLPQLSNGIQSDDVASILEALGSSLSALGKALKHHRN